MKEYFGDILNCIRHSLETLDESQMEKLLSDCQKAVLSGNKIIASGLGKNVPICEKFVGTLHSMGISGAFLHTNTALHGDLGVIREGDLVILLSKSGNTEESITLARHLKDREVSTWLLSFNYLSSLTKIIDNKLILSLDREGDDWDIVPNNSSTIYLILLQGLAVMLGRRMGVTMKAFLKNHPGGSIGRAHIREEGHK
jgi:arabinose-5-phosphate isomerase